MKRLTLDETWKHCLSMWRWIVKQVRQFGVKRYSLLCKHEKKIYMENLKTQWLKKHGFSSIGLDNRCFFCDYANRVPTAPLCSRCPATLVSTGFHCNCDGKAEYFKHSYLMHPIAFYNKLVSLNRKRLKKKGSN